MFWGYNKDKTGSSSRKWNHPTFYNNLNLKQNHQQRSLTNQQYSRVTEMYFPFVCDNFDLLN